VKGRERLIAYDRFPKIISSLLDRIALTRNIQLRAERHIPVSLTFNNHCELLLHSVYPQFFLQRINLLLTLNSRFVIATGILRDIGQRFRRDVDIFVAGNPVKRSPLE